MGSTPTDQDLVLRCDGLTRRFGDRTAVDNVSFHVARGETYGLLGPNGSGKTTTISMLSGILLPDAGTVTLVGKSLTPSSTEAKRAVGLVPQEIALYQDLSAAENLRFFGRLQGLSGKHLQARVASVLEVVGLRDRADDRVEEFSGGMKRRVNIAAGMLHEPQLIVLDEPTVGVDPQSRNQILDSIEVLGGEGVSVLYTTHYMEEAERLCDRIGILDGGRLIAEGTQSELVSRVGEYDLVIVDTPAVDDEALLAAIAATPGVADVEVTTRGLEVSTTGGRATLGPLVAAFTACDAEIAGLQLREPNLEAVFLDLTGRALRDT
ncbi:MAG: ABC transporter ATP-binding protein [Acidimicrobiales bacterium]